MTEKFCYLVNRLYEAGERLRVCQTGEEKRTAQRWLVLWNRALRREHERRAGTPAQRNAAGN